MVYENKGEKSTKNSDGSTTITHNIYNTGAGYGVAEVRDKNGNVVDQVVISPNKVGVSLYEVAGEMKDVVKGYWDGLSMFDSRAAANSEKSTLRYTVPEGGSVTFTKGSYLAATLNTLATVLDVVGYVASAKDMKLLGTKLLAAGIETWTKIEKGDRAELDRVFGLITTNAVGAGLSYGLDKAVKAGLLTLGPPGKAVIVMERFRKVIITSGNSHNATRDWRKARKEGADAYIIGPNGLMNSRCIHPTPSSFLTGQAGPNNTGLNQTTTERSQIQARKQGEESATSDDGNYALVSHPWYLIGTPESGDLRAIPVAETNPYTQTGSSTYTQWGYWYDAAGGPLTTGPGIGGGGTPAFWIAGQITPAHAVPTTGTATYTGTLEGSAHTYVFATDTRSNSQLVSGTFALTAAFAARTLDGSFSFTSGFLPGTALTAAGGWGAGSVVHFGTLTAPGVYQGNFAGYLFGPDASGIGGVWNAKTATGAAPGSEIKAYGTYNGTRGAITP